MLIPREVLSFTAPEVADLLDTTVASARTTLATDHTTCPRPLSATE